MMAEGVHRAVVVLVTSLEVPTGYYALRYCSDMSLSKSLCLEFSFSLNILNKDSHRGRFGFLSCGCNACGSDKAVYHTLHFLQCAMKWLAVIKNSRCLVSLLTQVNGHLGLCIQRWC